MSTPDRLREAAALLRERASAATSASGASDWFMGTSGSVGTVGVGSRG